jgi:uridine phosphorylase
MGGAVAAATIGVGGPATAVLIEELAVSAVRQIIAVDIAASLHSRMRSGDVALVGHAFCGDGTSAHYAERDVQVLPDEDLTERLRSALVRSSINPVDAGAWSTDAPYRETATAVATWRARGASIVDMETAALLASCAALGIAAAAVLVVADELFEGWSPPGDMKAVQSQLKRTANAAVQCLKS